MKTPRNISGKEVIRKLQKLGYEPTRQSVSHIRLTTLQNGEHHITIPNHDPLRVGTLSSILNDVADHFGILKDEVIKLIQ